MSFTCSPMYNSQNNGDLFGYVCTDSRNIEGFKDNVQPSRSESRPRSENRSRSESRSRSETRSFSEKEFNTRRDSKNKSDSDNDSEDNFIENKNLKYHDI